MIDGRAAYLAWKDKGPASGGRRVTIMAEDTEIEPGQLVRVHHVVEVLDEGLTAYPMGPKVVTDEYLDDRLMTPSGDDDPLAPKEYDGATLRGPALDLGWDVTSYRLDRPGRHTIQWRPAGLRSNVLEVEVVQRDAPQAG